MTEGAHPKAAFFETRNATKPPLINRETVDEDTFESANGLPLAPKLGTKSIKIGGVLSSNYDLFSA